MTGIRRMCRLVAFLVMLSSLPALAQMTTPGSSLSAARAAAEPDNSSTSSSITLPTVEVVGVTPVPGSGVDIDKVPAETQVLNGADVTREGNAGALRRGETHALPRPNERMPAFRCRQLLASTASCPWPRRFAVDRTIQRPAPGLETAGNLANVG
jgi:hypothetical protein